MCECVDGEKSPQEKTNKIMREIGKDLEIKKQCQGNEAMSRKLY